MKKIILLCLATLMITACERQKDNDPRKDFVGDYTFVSKGNIDLYAGVLKITTIPMDKKSEMSLSLADKDNELWMVAEGDSTIARLSDGRLFIDPTTEQQTFKDLVLTLSYTYTPATLENDQLSLTSNVEITATYKEHSLSGRGQVDIVATKK